jgi:phosphatidate cytidylyltransferase
MKQRIITAAIALLALMLVLFVLPETAALIVIVVVMLAGAWEWSAFLGVSGSVGRFAYVAFIGALLAAVSIPAVDVTLVLTVSVIWWLLALIWAFFFPTPIPAVVRWMAGAFVLVPLYVASIMLYRGGPMSLLFALLIVWVADSGAFFAGKTMGRVKLAPKIESRGICAVLPGCCVPLHSRRPYRQHVQANCGAERQWQPVSGSRRRAR